MLSKQSQDARILQTDAAHSAYQGAQKHAPWTQSGCTRSTEASKGNVVLEDACSSVAVLPFLFFPAHQAQGELSGNSLAKSSARSTDEGPNTTCPGLNPWIYYLTWAPT